MRKASAWYFTAYQAGAILSFGWIMNRLMSDIIKLKQLPQEEHQAWKRIGKAVEKYGFAMPIRNTVSLEQLKNGELENISDVEKLGWQLLNLIDQWNETSQGQEFANHLLIFLHNVALNIL